MIPRAGQAVPSKDGWSLLNFGKVFFGLVIAHWPASIENAQGEGSLWQR